MYCSMLRGTLAASLVAVVAGATLAQTERREGRIEARGERQEGRVEARAQGEFDSIDGRYTDRVYDDEIYVDDEDVYVDEYRGRRGYDWREAASLGVTLDPSYRRGALVSQVYRGSAAEAAGLRPGDVIIGVNGRRVSSPDALAQLISRHEPGSRVEIDFTRRVRRTLEARLGSSGMTWRGPVYRDQDVYVGERAFRDDIYWDGGRETTRLRVDDDRDIDEGLIFDRDRDRRRFEVLRPRD